MSIATQSIPNFEEAASIASEFITSLDNLPNEVQHLLQEIKLKDQRCQELQQDITRDQMKYIRRALKQNPSLSSPFPNSNDQNKSGTASPTTAPNGLNPRTHLPGRITAAYREIDALNEEKMVLAQRIIDLITRTRARLDVDLVKVRTLQGESADDIRASSYKNSANYIRSASPYGLRRAETSAVLINPIVQIGDNIRHVASDNIISISPAPGSSYNKKRRITMNTSVKLSSPSVAPSTTSRSRLPRHSHTTRSQQKEEDLGLDADADGEDDLEGEDAEEDLTLYCFCHKQSYGDMIGCDNLDCSYQWFHIACVGVKTPLPDKWYCPECIKTRSGVSEKRKGRKK